MSKETINVDEDGYETVRRPRQRTIGQFMPEISPLSSRRKRKKKAKAEMSKRLDMSEMSRRLDMSFPSTETSET